MGWMIWYLNPCKGKTFISPKTSRPRLGPTQGYFQEVKQPGSEAAYSPTSSTEVQDEWSHTSVAPLCFHFVDRDNFTLSLHNFNMFHHIHSTLKHLQLGVSNLPSTMFAEHFLMQLN